MSGQWYRNGTAIPGAINQSYLLTEDDVGANIHYTEIYQGFTIDSAPIVATWVRKLQDGTPALLDMDFENDRYWYDGVEYTRTTFQNLSWVPDDISTSIQLQFTTGSEPFVGFNATAGVVIHESTSTDNNVDAHVITFSDGTTNNYVGNRIQWSAGTPNINFISRVTSVNQAQFQSKAATSGVRLTQWFKYKQDDFWVQDSDDDPAYDNSGTLPSVTRMMVGCAPNSTASSPLQGSVHRITYFPGDIRKSDIDILMGIDVITIAYSVAGMLENDGTDARDVMGTGLPALLTSNQDGRIWWWEQTSRNVWTQRVITSNQPASAKFEGVAWIDYAGDGNLGVVGVDQENGNVWFWTPDSPGVYSGTWSGSAIQASRSGLQDCMAITQASDDRESILYTWEGSSGGNGGVNKLRWNGSAWTDVAIVQMNGAWHLHRTPFADGTYLVGARTNRNAGTGAGAGAYKVTIGGVGASGSKTALWTSDFDWTRMEIGNFFGNTEDIASVKGPNDDEAAFYLFNSANSYAMTTVSTSVVGDSAWNIRKTGATSNGRDVLLITGYGTAKLWAWNGNTAWTSTKDFSALLKPGTGTTGAKSDDTMQAMNIFRRNSADAFVYGDSLANELKAIRIRD
jgi:hypothetical protein